MDKKQRGRPKHIDRVTISEGLAILDDLYRATYSIKTIYNNISSGKLTNHGTISTVMLDKDELIDWHAKKIRPKRSLVA